MGKNTNNPNRARYVVFNCGLSYQLPRCVSKVVFSCDYQQYQYCGTDVLFVSEVSFIPLNRLFLFFRVISFTQ